MEAVGANVADFRVVGIRPQDFLQLLQGGGTSNALIWSRIFCGVLSDWEDPGQLPP